MVYNIDWTVHEPGRDIRNASKVLRPSEKPFFSPKAPSSKPWSAKPFIRSCLVHRSINVRCSVSVYDSSFSLIGKYCRLGEDDSYSSGELWRQKFSPMKRGLEPARPAHHLIKAGSVRLETEKMFEIYHQL